MVKRDALVSEPWTRVGQGVEPRFDLPIRSDRLHGSSMITTIRGRYRGMAAPLAVLLLMFCLSVALPAGADETGCGGLDTSGRICTQSGSAMPIVAVVHDQPPIQTFVVPGIALSPDGVSAEPVQHHADPSTPRAPPGLA